MKIDTKAVKALRVKGLWWFRVFGFGLWAASFRQHPPLFSERDGSHRALSLGSWQLRLLT